MAEPKTCNKCGSSFRSYGYTCRECGKQATRERQKNAVTPDLRRWIMWRDGCACVECHSIENLQVDHIIPVIDGGRTDPTNLQVLCQPCNGSKGTESLHQHMREHLLAEPPVEIFSPLVPEFGLVKAAILSSLLAQPGHLRLGGIIDLRKMANRLGVGRDEILQALGELQDHGAVSFTKRAPTTEVTLLVSLDEWWATTGSFGPSNSTGRQEALV